MVGGIISNGGHIRDTFSYHSRSVYRINFQLVLNAAYSCPSSSDCAHWSLKQSHFYRAMHNSAKRGIAIACRPSVRLWRWWIRTTSVGNLGN